MNDYQRGLLKGAEITSEKIVEYSGNYACALYVHRAIRAEAAKAAEAPGVQEICDMQNSLRQEAPDEALIAEVTARWRECYWFDAGNPFSVRKAVKDGIREYLKRREGK